METKVSEAPMADRWEPKAFLEVRTQILEVPLPVRGVSVSVNSISTSI